MSEDPKPRGRPRQRAEGGVCAKRHAIEGENVLHLPGGRVGCRTCRNEYRRGYTKRAPASPALAVTPAELAALRRVVEIAANYTDCGPYEEGWQSCELEQAVAVASQFVERGAAPELADGG